jgi:hypothetical protein
VPRAISSPPQSRPGGLEATSSANAGGAPHRAHPAANAAIKNASRQPAMKPKPKAGMRRSCNGPGRKIRLAIASKQVSGAAGQATPPLRRGCIRRLGESAAFARLPVASRSLARGPGKGGSISRDQTEARSLTSFVTCSNDAPRMRAFGLLPANPTTNNTSSGLGEPWNVIGMVSMAS